MRNHERINNAPPYEIEHFDDFEAADIALRGLERISRERRRKELGSQAKLETGPEAHASADTEDENEAETKVEDAYDDDYYEDEYWDEDYDYGPERSEELEREQRFELFTIPPRLAEEYKLPRDLPPGVAIMGGTARSLARRLITGDTEPIRDLDLVYIPELADLDSPPTAQQLDELSARYMPDDYVYDHGIGTEKLERYFETRDFTINQCLIAGDRLLITQAAYDDFQENIIRPSYDSQQSVDQPINQRLFIKALLLQAVFQECTKSYPMLEDFCLDDIDEVIAEYDSEYDNYNEEDESEGEDDGIRLYPFNLALTLNKAMSRGAEIATNFIRNLVDYDVIDPIYLNEPLKLARKLRDRCYNFDFRPVDDSIDGDSLEYQDLYEEFTGLNGYQPHDQAIKSALNEYRSSNINHSNEELPERWSGKYSQDEYDWINREGKYATPKTFKEDLGGDSE